MSVVIRPEDGQPDSLKALLAAVSKHAGNEPVTVGSGGVVVSRAVAKKFLNARGSTDADTTGRTVDNTRTPLLTRHSAEERGTTPDDATEIGGLTPEGDNPGGYPGVPADAQTTAAAGQQAADPGSAPDASGGASGAEPTPAAEPDPAPVDPAPARKSTPAKKTTTAAAQQRASRSNARSNP